MPTKIEWAEETWSPITGCTKISPGCQNCYAERIAKRLGGRYGYPADDPFKVALHPSRLDKPLSKWKMPRMIFVCSMGDLFHDDVPVQYIIDCLSIMAEASQHTFLILTKRPERMKDIICHDTVANDVWLQTSKGVNDEPSLWPLPNVWLGVTAENQEHADKRIPILLQIPAAVRFISVEPMLGPVEIEQYFPEYNYLPTYDYFRLATGCDDNPILIKPGLDWVICGGESGPGARPMHPDWARGLRDQCLAAGVPFLFKQWGEWAPFVPAGVFGSAVHDWDENNWSAKIGKHKAGRLLDGKLWDEYPEVKP